jgi:hypothetical protein
MLSSIPMKLIPSYNIMVLLLLLAFLTTSVGNVFGYAWCIGDDGHVGIDSVAGKGCCIDVCKSDYTDRKYDVSAISQTSEYCSQCLDFSTLQTEAVFFKRLKRIPTVSKVTVTPNVFPPIAVQNLKMVAGNLILGPQPRISQTILAHRTVVLRN